MSLLFPLGLLAVAAWLLPLLIHLARRHPYTPVDFAALRWLRARIRPRQRIRFDDWPLLLVRLLLLAALALLLARPALTGPEAAPAAWTVVAPGLDAAALRGTDDPRTWHWLAPGFPPIGQPAPPGDASLPSLLRELDAKLPAGTALTVYVPDPLPGLDGARLRLSRAVQWRPRPLAARASQAVPAPPRLRLKSDAPAAAQHWLTALQRAWGGQPLAAPLSADALPEHGETGVWTSADPLPTPWQAWVNQGGSVLSPATPPAGARLLLRDAQGAPLLWEQPSGRGHVLYLPGEWDAGRTLALRDDHLPRQLLQALQPPSSPRLGDALDQAPQRAPLPPTVLPARELAAWLMLVILMLFALERWMASSARRRQPA